MQERIVVISPTKLEIEPFMKSPAAGRITAVEIGGVGMAEISAATCRAIGKHSPTWLILAGIAGYYPDSELKTGDVTLVASECVADLGAMHPNGFLPMYTKKYACPYADMSNLRKVASYTVSTAAGPFVVSERAHIENMEGAAFFSICLQSGIRFLELRSMSNPVSTDRKRWNIPLAIHNLAAELGGLIETLPATGL